MNLENQTPQEILQMLYDSDLKRFGSGSLPEVKHVNIFVVLATVSLRYIAGCEQDGRRKRQGAQYHDSSLRFQRCIER